MLGFVGLKSQILADFLQSQIAMYILGIIEEGNEMGLNDEDSRVGKIKRIAFMLLSSGRVTVLHFLSTMKTINCFRLSETSVPDDSLCGYWYSMDA